MILLVVMVLTTVACGGRKKPPKSPGRTLLSSGLLRFLHRRGELGSWGEGEVSGDDNSGYGWLNGGCWRRERAWGRAAFLERERLQAERKRETAGCWGR